jgi:hypothetical protein
MLHSWLTHLASWRDVGDLRFQIKSTISRFLDLGLRHRYGDA